jgi:hypothetical protein
MPSTVSGTRRRTKTVRHSHSHREREKGAAATRILLPKPALVASFFSYLRGARVCGWIWENLDSFGGGMRFFSGVKVEHEVKCSA